MAAQHANTEGPDSLINVPVGEDYSDLMLVQARTTQFDEVKNKVDGISTFLIDIREALGKGLVIRPIKAMVNHHATEVFFDNLDIPADSLVGEEGKGLRYILDGMNAERMITAAEALWNAADASMQTHGGFGFTREYNVERKWREARQCGPACARSAALLLRRSRNRLAWHPSPSRPLRSKMPMSVARFVRAASIFSCLCNTTT